MRSILEDIEDNSPQGIAGAVGRLINAGTLAPGDRLPTVRELAEGLGVSPATVSHAWQALSAVGMIISRGRAGTFVRDQPVPWLPHRSRRLAGREQGARLDLSRGTPDPLLLPDLGPALSRASDQAGTSSYQDVPVLAELRSVLQSSWPYPVESITVVDGALDAISRSLEQLVRFGDRVIVENPTFPPFFDLLEVLGAQPLPVMLDECGIVPGSLERALRQRPRAALLQPRSHNPTGTSMSAERAAELAQVLRRSRHGQEMVVIEDDHSGEVSTAPDISLGSWLPDRVLHVRSFSKSHGPDLRIAALGGPAELVDRIVSRRMLGPGWTSRMTQRILHDLLTNGSSMAQVNEARRQYYWRQKQLAAALAASGYAARPADGINVWLQVDNERDALVQLAAAGIRVAGGSSFQVEAAPDAQFIRVTAGMIRESAEDVARSLAAAASASPSAMHTLETRWS